MPEQLAAPERIALLPVSRHALGQAIAAANAHVESVVRLIKESERPPDGWALDLSSGEWRKAGGAE